MAPQKRYGRFLSSKDEETVKERKPKELSKKEVLHIAKYLEEIYGIEPSIIKSLSFLKKRDDVWLVSKKASTLLPFENTGLKINTIGFRAVRNSFKDSPKITTNFAQYLGNNITKNLKELNDDDLQTYIHGHDVDTIPGLRGYCVLKYKGYVVGVGLATETLIKNQIPKGRVLKNLLIMKPL